MDYSGNGTGDIKGIISKLDYLENLGIDGIWVSPIYPSPMKDFGYDISDYKAIDPEFGTEKDFDNLIKEAGKRGIKIIMDIVFNHTSDQHPWFIESRSSVSNPKRDWYIWKKSEKEYPNNWLGFFGGRAWELDDTTRQYYLHSFLAAQPDLNWRNPEILKQLIDTMDFWIKRGVSGFRFDVINLFVKDDLFRNNPWTLSKRPRPYDLQKHIYDRNRPELHSILKEIRKATEKRGEIMTVGEVVADTKGNAELASSYLGRNDELHLAFDFSLIDTPWQADKWYFHIKDWLEKCSLSGGWPCHVLSNHDQSRTVSRLGGNRKGRARAKAAAAILLTLKGTPFLYYGEEIGMSDCRIKKHQLVDPVGIRYWPLHPGRDPERTPMQWNSSLNAGFSKVTPWLPVNSEFKQINVETETSDPLSILNFYKDLIFIRKNSEALTYGEWIPFIEGLDDLIGYFRIKGRQKILVIVNFSSGKKECFIPEIETYRQLLSSSETTQRPPDISGRVNLQGYEAVIMEKTG